MSQNSYTLILIFKDQPSHETCVLAFHHLQRGNPEQSEPYQQRLGLDLSALWREQWFNQEFKATPDFLMIGYDCSVHKEPPYELLRDLFKVGLAAAAMEVFHDQVGEYQREHFFDGKLVDSTHLLKAMPEMAAVIEAEFAELDDSDEVNRPVVETVALQALIDEEQRRRKKAMEMVDGLLSLTRSARESGINPVELAKSAVLIGSLVRGLIHALLFTVVCVLLFKGLWLWIGLGVALCVILPLKYMAQSNREMSEEPEEEVIAC